VTTGAGRRITVLLGGATKNATMAGISAAGCVRSCNKASTNAPWAAKTTTHTRARRLTGCAGKENAVISRLSRNERRRSHIGESGQDLFGVMPIDLNGLVATLFPCHKRHLTAGASKPIGEPVDQRTVGPPLYRTRLEPNLKPPIVPALHLGMARAGLAVDMQFSHGQEALIKNDAYKF
jgi:hypothetical protein